MSKTPPVDMSVIVQRESIVPEKPFDVSPSIRRGGVTYPSLYSLPYDTAFRTSADLNNLPQGLAAAFASIGVALYNEPTYKFVPASTIVRVFAVHETNGDEFKNLLRDNPHLVLVTDRRSSNVTVLHVLQSALEGVISWFVRDKSHDFCVLCRDRTQGLGGFYVEPLMGNLISWIGADGTETREEESERFIYRIDMHDNAIMVYGE